MSWKIWNITTPSFSKTKTAPALVDAGQQEVVVRFKNDFEDHTIVFHGYRHIVGAPRYYVFTRDVQVVVDEWLKSNAPIKVAGDRYIPRHMVAYYTVGPREEYLIPK